MKWKMKDLQSITIKGSSYAATDCGTTIAILVGIIIYTLENQQVIWNEHYHILNQGIPTGAKHCVPLANTFLIFTIRSLL